MACFVIAEVGVNHNGSLDLARQLIDASLEAGADAVKFQTFRAHELARAGAPTAEYQKAQTGVEDQRAMLEALELSREAHQQLFDHCRVAGIEFMSSVFSESAVALLETLGVGRLKIPSGEITNRRLLQRAAQSDRPIILSTGMADLDEVHRATRWICAEWNERGRAQDVAREELTLLQCTSNYPTADDEVNLSAMHALAGLGYPVGFSDHTPDVLLAPCAVAMGATVIEKHITSNRDLEGPDHAASLDPQQFGVMVANIRRVEQALGNGTKLPQPGELPVRDVARKSVTLVRDVETGDVITEAHVDIMRPGTGIAPFEMDNVIGCRAVQPLRAPCTLSWSHLTKDVDRKSGS